MRNKQKASLFFGIVFAMALALMSACSPSEPAKEDPNPDSSQQVEAAAWSPEGDCATCHMTEASSFGDAACAAAFHSTMNCITCHTDTAGLEAQHDGVTAEDKAATRLKKTTVSDSVCLGCHDAAELSADTADYADLVDNNGTVVNPHDLPTNEEHLESIHCSSCHKLHKDTTETQGEAAWTCKNCHHQGVFECYTCHD